ncbi:hypothetical protein C8F01DRAFT_1115266 [Mycena amicta]|nr:hypothetical protein C8F01DRAFT_1115266 [Mycena amicta]
MSDSFADLWNSSTSTKPAAPKLGSSPPVQIPNSYNNNAQARRPPNDLFSMLSAASPSNSRPITPNTQAVKPAAASGTGSGDAFSGLLGSSLNGGNSMANMTIAQRAQMQQQTKTVPASNANTNSAWAGLDSLSSFASSKPAAPATKSMLDDDDWGFMSTTTNPAPVLIAANDDDDWGLASSTKKPTPAPAPAPSPKPTPKSMGLWDHIDDFASSPPPAQSPPARFASPSAAFDFGDREDARAADEFDLLGDLGKPVSEISSRRSTPARETPPPRSQRQRPPSPPPHILGQLIEMGFTIPQSRAALSQVYNTADGQWDVQSAIDSLLASTGGAEGSSRRGSPAPGPPAHPSRRRPDDRERERTGSPRQQPPERITTPTTNDLLARTSELGFSLFRGAERAWQQGKERVQKAYVEHVAGEELPGAPAAAASKQNGAGPARPKWMQQDLDDDEEAKGKGKMGEDADSLFRDDDGDERKADDDDGWGDARKAAVTPPTVDLFVVDDDARPAQQRPPTQRRKTAPKPSIPPRAQIPLSPTTLQTSRTHSAAANEKMALGQYAAASALYTLAIDALPGGHVLLVPLLIKRAEARLKEGDFRGVEEDCVGVEGIAGEGGRTVGVEGVVRVDGGEVEVNMGAAVLDAWKRRAEALEGRERWADAGKDWERVAGAAWAGIKDRDEGVRGAGRCRKMMEPKPTAAVSKPKPKPKPQPAPAATGPPPEAVTKYRASLQAQEDEDTARHLLKDAVDAKLLAWKGGKETNIRALLASLETVLWPEVGLQVSGMKDLVTPGQVKVRYVKAIARLHPDKLSVGNSTLEQRMLAGGVFAALNEAWNAFK